MEASIKPLSREQLDACFRSLGDVNAALATFGRLADKLLARDEPANCASPLSSPPLDHFDSAGLTSPSSSSSSSSSSSAASLAPSSPCCASCTSNWPAAAASHLGSRRAPPFSSSASSASQGYSTSSFSGASSICSDDSAFKSRTSARKSAQPSQRRESRRVKNACAAEKYRKRLKKSRSGLAAELEREQARNARLRQSLGAKLVLYREFADLLAQNTRDERDGALASVGAGSLANILDFIWPACEERRLATGNGDELGEGAERRQLEQLLAHFKQVQARATPSSRAQAGDEEAELECDFYADRLLPLLPPVA